MKKMIFLLTMMLTFAVTSAQTLPDLSKNSKAVEKVVTETKSAAKTSSNAVATVYGDTKEGVTTIYSDIKSLAPDAKSAMQEIIKTLKATSNKVWDLLVKQQLVWSWCYLIAELFALFAVYKFYNQLKIAKTEKNETGETLTVNWVQCALTGLVAAVLTGISITHFQTMMTGFINPEFGALMQLVELAKTIKV